MSNRELVWAVGCSSRAGKGAREEGWELFGAIRLLGRAIAVCHSTEVQNVFNKSARENPLSSSLGSPLGTWRGSKVSGAFSCPGGHPQLSQPVSPQATQQSPALNSMINHTAGSVSLTGKHSRTIAKGTASGIAHGF